MYCLEQTSMPMAMLIADMCQYPNQTTKQPKPNQTTKQYPNQTNCSPNALFGTNTDADGHADMYQYTGKVGFSNIFIGPRFSSNQLVRRSVCRSRHHQQLNTVEANWAMQCNASGLQSYHADHNRDQQGDDGYDEDHDGDVEGWRMGPRSVRGWIKGSTPLWSLLQHTQSRHNTATTHTQKCCYINTCVFV